MNNELPTDQPSNSLFPSILRFITEDLLSRQSILYAKMGFISFLSGILVFNILIQANFFLQGVREVKQLQQDRVSVTKELQYWKQTANTYQGYRDVYFRIAALEYKVGDVKESKHYMEKALSVDPNFEAGRVLGDKIQK